jgi:hypothetical protein
MSEVSKFCNYPLQHNIFDLSWQVPTNQDKGLRLARRLPASLLQFLSSLSAQSSSVFKSRWLLCIMWLSYLAIVLCFMFHVLLKKSCISVLHFTVMLQEITGIYMCFVPKKGSKLRINTCDDCDCDWMWLWLTVVVTECDCDFDWLWPWLTVNVTVTVTDW